MSYDLMVFDPAIAPAKHSQFMEWYNTQTLWQETHGYNNPAVTSPNLFTWFSEIIGNFPPMNGPLAQEELPEDEATLADYSLGCSVIYVAFAWSKAQQAYETAFQLAAKHKVGFFDVSSGEEEIWLPDGINLVLRSSK